MSVYKVRRSDELDGETEDYEAERAELDHGVLILKDSFSRWVKLFNASEWKEVDVVR